ncbi:MAG: bifunctional hydroxymethylpyrimidine kinase/phosphomethylpyrimidine kinase, partial [Pseudomonadota bacterium]
RRVRNLGEMKEAAKIIKEMGPDVVITGGHMKNQCLDLVYDGRSFHEFGGAKIKSKHTHGTGCVYSAALATFQAMGHGLTKAAELANGFTRRALEHGYACGKGPGPVNPV